VRYAERVYRLTRAVETIRDGRVKPRIPTAVVVKSLLLMHWARLGSFNALEGLRPGRWLRRWLGDALHSADNLGDVAEVINVADVRAVLREHYRLRRRKKTLRPVAHGVWPLVLDGHEINSSFLRSCPGCLRRTVHTKHGDRIQYYHRCVLALLVHADGVLLLDVELQEPGEDEIGAARRLLARAIDQYPRAFNVVVGDALYLHPGLWRQAWAHGKYCLAVLKNEDRDLLVDARSLFSQLQPTVHRHGRTEAAWWDIEGFTTWSQFGQPVRVVRSVETTTVRRQATRSEKAQTVEWLWATNLPVQLASTASVVRIGHRRWSIENEGFNEVVNHWHANHIYKHHPNAILVLWLLLCLAFNLCGVFLRRNLKPALRDLYSQHQWLDLIKAGLYAAMVAPRPGHPP